MNNSIKKLFLSIKSSDHNDEYFVEFENSKLYPDNNQINCFELDLDITKRNSVTINYTKKISGSFLEITEIKFNNIVLNNLDKFTTYKTIDNKIKKTYNWIDELGTFKINLHQNAHTHQLLSYLLSKK